MWKLKHVLRSPDDDGSGGPAAPTPAPAAASPAAPAPVDDSKPGYWAQDWRERLAGTDDKALAQLKRYASPEDVWKKARALEVERSSGRLKPVLEKDSTPEQLAEYRKAWGIPEAADKYDLTGVSVDDADKPLLGKVFAELHGAHATTDQAKAVAKAWATVKSEALASQHAKDTETQKKTEDELRGEWGTEYRRNMSLVTQLLDGNGDQKTIDNFLRGRLADGTPIGSSATALKLLLGVALKSNPTGTVVPSGGGDPAASIESEIATIEKTMRENRKAYNNDEKMQERYRTLIDARETMRSRRA